ncbi:uncharacterized [Tachysurus ichikawai]
MPTHEGHERDFYISVGVQLPQHFFVEIWLMIATSDGVHLHGYPEKTPPGVENNRCKSNMLGLPGVLNHVHPLFRSQLSTALQ